MSARILLVEDDPALLTILQASIAYGGFTADAVGSGAEAIELF
jgi:CheY-like chemotaxis protein